MFAGPLVPSLQHEALQGLTSAELAAFDRDSVDSEFTSGDGVDSNDASSEGDADDDVTGGGNAGLLRVHMAAAGGRLHVAGGALGGSSAVRDSSSSFAGGAGGAVHDSSGSFAAVDNPIAARGKAWAHKPVAPSQQQQELAELAMANVALDAHR